MIRPLCIVEPTLATWVTLGALVVETTCGLPRREAPLGLQAVPTAMPGHPPRKVLTSRLLKVPRLVLLYSPSLHPALLRLASMVLAPAPVPPSDEFGL